MSRFQGIGNVYYGKTDYNSVNYSYITTEWFVLFLLPIFPRKCLRVIKEGKREKNTYLINSMGYSSTVSYRIIEKIPFKNNLRQIFSTYIVTYVPLALFIGFCILANSNDLFIWVLVGMFSAFLIFALIKSE